MHIYMCLGFARTFRKCYAAAAVSGFSRSREPGGFLWSSVCGTRQATDALANVNDSWDFGGATETAGKKEWEREREREEEERVVSVSRRFSLHVIASHCFRAKNSFPLQRQLCSCWFQLRGTARVFGCQSSGWRIVAFFCGKTTAHGLFHLSWRMVESFENREFLSFNHSPDCEFFCTFVLSSFRGTISSSFSSIFPRAVSNSFDLHYWIDELPADLPFPFYFYLIVNFVSFLQQKLRSRRTNEGLRICVKISTRMCVISTLKNKQTRDAEKRDLACVWKDR